MQEFKGKGILITGGTGSLGKALLDRLLQSDCQPNEIVVFSRDEYKQYQLAKEYAGQPVTFVLGDVRDYESVERAVRNADIVIHAAALKHVPNGEIHTEQFIYTNVLGTLNIRNALLKLNDKRYRKALLVSTDKACKPINAMGMTKALAERVFIEGAAAENNYADFRICRYGNVVSSRGSVIPLFLSQGQRKTTITITSDDMTRFLLTLEQAVETALMALKAPLVPGSILVPIINSVKIKDVAEYIAKHYEVCVGLIGVRPGEKLHEVLITEEESWRTSPQKAGGYFVVLPHWMTFSYGVKRVDFTEYSSNLDMCLGKDMSFLDKLFENQRGF